MIRTVMLGLLFLPSALYAADPCEIAGFPGVLNYDGGCLEKSRTLDTHPNLVNTHPNVVTTTLIARQVELLSTQNTLLTEIKSSTDRMSEAMCR